MLIVSKCIALAALERKESRGGHTRDDFPAADPEWGKVNVILRKLGADVTLSVQPLPQLPDELQHLFDDKGKK
jgi:succinate dehydrogenase / fumarate reductase, flavoprotein subunit